MDSDVKVCLQDHLLGKKIIVIMNLQSRVFSLSLLKKNASNQHPSTFNQDDVVLIETTLINWIFFS